jgi:hypothetical protein
MEGGRVMMINVQLRGASEGDLRRAAERLGIKHEQMFTEESHLVLTGAIWLEPVS